LSAFGSAVSEPGQFGKRGGGGGAWRIEPFGIRASHEHRFVPKHGCRPRPARQTRQSDVLHHRPVFNGRSTVPNCKLTLARSSSPSCRQRQSHPRDRTLKGMWRQTGRWDAIRPLLQRALPFRKFTSQPGPWAAVGETEMKRAVRPQQHVKPESCVCQQEISADLRDAAAFSGPRLAWPGTGDWAAVGLVKVGGKEPGGRGMEVEGGDSGGGGTVRPKAEARGGTYNIRGVDVQFPFEPYAAQMAFMNKVMATLHCAHTRTRTHPWETTLGRRGEGTSTAPRK
jgi:hypothetical protein